MIETNALAPSTRAGGRWSNFSISGKLMSTCGRCCERRLSRSSGRRCSVCGPNTTSTYGARSMIAAPSWLATQPPTPISTPLAFRCLTRPRSLNNFSCAFSRTEQVLKTIRSASSPSSVGSYARQRDHVLLRADGRTRREPRGGSIDKNLGRADDDERAAQRVLRECALERLGRGRRGDANGCGGSKSTAVHGVDPVAVGV